LMPTCVKKTANKRQILVKSAYNNLIRTFSFSQTSSR
jgi:hypothetical protein